MITSQIAPETKESESADHFRSADAFSRQLIGCKARPFYPAGFFLAAGGMIIFFKEEKSHGIDF